MLSRPILGCLMLAAAAPCLAEPSPPAAFEQRIVAVMSAGGAPETVQGRLSRIGADTRLTPDQRIAVDALQVLVRGKARAKGLSSSEAEAFAAQHPGSPAATMLLAEAALANDDPRRGADLLIEAARKAGSLVQLVSPATVSNLTGKLDGLSDRQRIAGLGRALLDAGWTRGSASLRSYLALAAIRDEIGADRVAEARRLLAAVRTPATLHLVLIDNRLAPLRDDVGRLAGPRLERAWRDLLIDSRDDWFRRGDLMAATAYAEALKQANDYETLASVFLERFVRGYNCPSDLVARSVGMDVADSLVKIGRWSKAEDVMRRLGGVSPTLYATMLLERGDYGRAQKLLDQALHAVDPAADDDDRRALAWLTAARACAAWRNGDRRPSSPYDPGDLDVSARLLVLLCTERRAEARDALLAALADEDERADALRWVQPFNDPALASPFRKEINGRIRELQSDAAVVAAVSRYGVILDWPLTAGVPAPASLGAAASPVAWRCGDQPDLETAYSR